MRYFVLLLVVVGMTTLYSQQQTQLEAKNVVISDTGNTGFMNKVTFEAYVKNTSATPLDFSSGAVVFNVNRVAVANGGTVTFSIGGSALPAAMQFRNPLTYTNADTIQLRTSAAAPSSYGSGALVIPVGGSVKLGVWSIKTTTQFAVDLLKLRFRTYLNATPPYTKIAYWFNSGNTTQIEQQATYVDVSPTIMLPVELKSFSGLINGRNVTLNWVTASESNFSHFIVERSNSNNWTAISSNIQAAGNSATPRNYSYTDSKLNTGKYSYRLKMVDKDGSYKYSAEYSATIDKPSSFDLSQNYPNPFNPTTRVEYSLANDAQVVVELYTLNGQKVATLVNEVQTAAYYSISIDVNKIANGLSSGVYLYRFAAVEKVSGQQHSFVKKMLLVK
jgi:hypothetical protein